MAIDDDEYIQVILHGAATPAKSWIPPGIDGHDPTYRNPVRYDPAIANTLLDRFAYRKGRDGYRRRPDGSKLMLSYIVSTNSRAREWSEFVKRSLDRIGIRVNFEALAAGERGGRMETCHFQLLDSGGWVFDWPDGSNAMLAFYGKADRAVQEACMQDREFDSMYERLIITPLGRARLPLYRRMTERLDALQPVRLLPARAAMFLTAPNIKGLLIHPALGDNFVAFPYLDVTPRGK